MYVKMVNTALWGIYLNYTEYLLRKYLGYVLGVQYLLRKYIFGSIGVCFFWGETQPTNITGGPTLYIIQNL